MVYSGGIWSSRELRQCETGEDTLSPLDGEGFGPRSLGQEALDPFTQTLARAGLHLGDDHSPSLGCIAERR